MDVKKLLKVYNYVNDEKRTRVNYKFAGALVAFLVAGAALVAMVALQGDDPQRAQAPAASAKTEYVGIDPSEAAAGRVDLRTAEQHWADWQRAHPNADVQSREDVRWNGVVIGWTVTYSE